MDQQEEIRQLKLLAEVDAGRIKELYDQNKMLRARVIEVNGFLHDCSTDRSKLRSKLDAAKAKLEKIGEGVRESET